MTSNLKQLYLLRHAEAGFEASNDFDRQLTDQGVGHAHKIGNWLKRQNSRPKLILSSNAKRAKETAEIVARTIYYDISKIAFSKALYIASSAEVEKYIQQVDNSVGHLLLIGHNPGLEQLAKKLAKPNTQPLNLLEGSMAEFEFNGLWSGFNANAVQLEQVIHAKKLR